jgi:16S rRNA (cytosine967-C5)-methyltransferase
VSETDAYANLLLPVKLDRAGLRGPDAALATELAYGTLRRRGYYDRVIELAASRSIVDIDPPIRDVLRLGAHQLLSMRVATHAAVDESVSLARSNGSQSATGFVNGVLRAISRTNPEDWLSRVLGAQATVEERLAAEYSHPAWIIRAFRLALAADGREGELVDLLDADNVAPLVSLAALPGLAEPSGLTGARLGRLSPIAATSEGGDPSRWDAVREGRVRVQDEGSQIAALALSRARPIRAGESWLDLCAGPGGKAAVLAAEALNGGATLVANEVSPVRAELVRHALAVFQNPPTVLERDGREFGSHHAASFDRILLDAPCSGLGALRRRPEARWRKQPSDIPALTKLQLELISSAAAALKPGGILAYVTCSPHVGETRVAVQHAVHSCSLVPLDTTGVVTSLSRNDPRLPLGDAVQLWPHVHGTDAMFIALFEKPREAQAAG